MERGVSINRPEADLAPSACPLHRVVLVTRVTRDGRLSQDETGNTRPLVATSMDDLLRQAELSHRFETESDQQPFVADIAIATMRDLDPKEIEKGGSGRRNDFAVLRRRRDAIARARMHVERRAPLGRLFSEPEQRDVAVRVLRQVADYLRATARGGENA